MKSTVGIFAVLCVVAVIAQATVITVPKQCSPEALETSSDPEMNRRLCNLLIPYINLPVAEQLNQEQYYSPSLNSGKKRQNGNDDHVFLRFGRRR